MSDEQGGMTEMEGAEALFDLIPDSDVDGSVHGDGLLGQEDMRAAEAGWEGVEDYEAHRAATLEQARQDKGDDLTPEEEQEILDEFERALDEGLQEREESEDEESTEDEDEDEESTHDEDVLDYKELIRELGDKQIKVRVAGEDVVVTGEELVAGYSRTADYTRKTQEVAEARREIEGAAAHIRGQAAAYTQRLEAVGGMLQRAGATPEMLQELAVEHQRVTAAMEKDALVQYDKRMAEEDRLLKAAKPELADPRVEQEWKEGLYEFAIGELGLAPEELSAIADHRAMLILDDARNWRRTQGTRQEVRSKVAKAPAVKPRAARRTSNSSSVKRHRENMDRLRWSGTRDDAARAIADLLGDD